MKKSLKTKIVNKSTAFILLAAAAQPFASAQSLASPGAGEPSSSVGAITNPLLGGLLGSTSPLSASLADLEAAGLPATAALPESSSDFVGGVPGIDGLNLSSEALANAFDGVELEMLGAILTPNGQPGFSAQFDEAYASRLPGLGGDEDELLAELPGIDGLPIALPR